MKRINLPAGTTHVPFGDLAHLIADALWPDIGPDDDRMAYGAARVNLDGELSHAVDASLFHGMGANPLPVKDPLTLGPHTFPVGNALFTALVTVNDVRAYVAGRGIDVIVERVASNPVEGVHMLNAHIQARLRDLPQKEVARWENAECDSDTRRLIMYRYAGLQGSGLATLEQFCEEVEGRLNRWRNGRYLVNEAAQVLADANPGLDAESFCKQMEQAIRSDMLTLRRNGIPLTAQDLTQHRHWNKTILQDDVNRWLVTMRAGYALGYPYEVPSKAAPVEAIGAPDGMKPAKVGPVN